MTLDEHWERDALRWAAWARRPGHDSYWHYRDAFFGLLPAPGGRTLDVGCGEGRVARHLAARGHRITGIDASPTLVRLAREAHPEGGYELADAAAMPFPDATFDFAVAYNSLMDVPDMPGTVREVARVLSPGGRLCASVTHPLSDAGSFQGDDADAPFVIAGTYFGRRPFEGTCERDGLSMTFRGWRYPLEDYARALEDAGFLIEAVREPRASNERLGARRGGERWRRLPMFLHLRAVKSRAGPPLGGRGRAPRRGR